MGLFDRFNKHSGTTKDTTRNIGTGSIAPSSWSHGVVIKYDLDGEKYTLDAHSVSELTDKLLEAKEFWIVELDDSKSEFIQFHTDYCEHWINGQPVVEKECNILEAFALLSANY